MITEALLEGGEYQTRRSIGIDNLLNVYNADTLHSVEILHLESKNGCDVYNISAPFEVNGHFYIAGRQEPPNNEFNYTTPFYRLDAQSKWRVYPAKTDLRLQDPSPFQFNGELIIGGVNAWPTIPGESKWKMEFWRGPDIDHLQWWADSPLGMKGVKFVEHEGKIGLFTRPQGEKDGLKSIRFRYLNSLDEFTVEAICEAEIIPGLFAEGEWGGVNQAKDLGDGTIGVLGHVARFEIDGNRSYYPMTFRFNPVGKEVTDYKIVASRRHSGLPDIKAKRPELYNIIYPGGWISTDTVDIIYGGMGDSCAAAFYTARLFPAKG